MIFESERTYVRSFKEEDLDDFMIYRNDMQWMTHQGFKGLQKNKYKKALIKEINYSKGSQLAIISKEDDILIGDLFILIDKKDAWIGYTISPDYARKGYTYEVLVKAIEWLRKDKLEIYAGVLEENIGSISLLKKLGFKYDHLDQNELIYKYRV